MNLKTLIFASLIATQMNAQLLEKKSDSVVPLPTHLSNLKFEEEKPVHNFTMPTKQDGVYWYSDFKNLYNRVYQQLTNISVYNFGRFRLKADENGVNLAYKLGARSNGKERLEEHKKLDEKNEVYKPTTLPKLLIPNFDNELPKDINLENALETTYVR